jgi:hypothetical protein
MSTSVIVPLAPGLPAGIVANVVQGHTTSPAMSDVSAVASEDVVGALSRKDDFSSGSGSGGLGCITIVVTSTEALGGTKVMWEVVLMGILWRLKGFT